jgi:hypothetical protein
VPGVATGLAVTGAGGDVLYVEATMMDGPEGLTLTGQLGDVMKESAEIALSYVRSHAGVLGIDPAVFAGKRFHVHVPAGAIPKDGPSAGVTMTTALVSLLRDVPVDSVLGMTGEVTLQGRVLPIGGVRQKVLAAHRAGLTTVVLPARNGPDLEDVPETVREEMTFHLASDIGEVLDAALSERERARLASDARPGTLGRLTDQVGRLELEVGEDRASSRGWSPWMLWPASSDRHHAVGGPAAAELGLVGVVHHRGQAPRTNRTGAATASRSSHSGPKSSESTWRPEAFDGRPSWCRHVHVPSSRCTALWSTPRRSDDSERVGLNWMVRSRISSKVANVSGRPERRRCPSSSRGRPPG